MQFLGTILLHIQYGKTIFKLVTACLADRLTHDHRPLLIKRLYERLSSSHSLCERAHQKCSQSGRSRLLATGAAAEATIKHALRKNKAGRCSLKDFGQIP